MLSVTANEPDFAFRKENYENVCMSPSLIPDDKTLEENRIESASYPIQEQKDEYVIEGQKLKDTILNLTSKLTEMNDVLNRTNEDLDQTENVDSDQNIENEVLEKFNTHTKEKMFVLEELVDTYKSLSNFFETRCNNYEEEVNRLCDTVDDLRNQLHISKESNGSLENIVDQINEQHQISEERNIYLQSLVSDDKENHDFSKEAHIMENVQMNKPWKEKAFESLIEEMFTISLTNSDVGLSYDSEDFTSKPVHSELELKMKSISEDLSLNSSHFDSSYVGSDNDEDSSEYSETGSEGESFSGSEKQSSSESEDESASESEMDGSEADDSIATDNSFE